MGRNVTPGVVLRCFLLFLAGLTCAGLLAVAGCAGGRNVQTAPDPATLQPYNGDVEIRDEEGQVISLLELTWSYGTPIVRRTCRRSAGSPTTTS